METQVIKEVQIAPSYGGGVACNVYLEDGTKCIVEIEEVKRILLKSFEEQGYKLDLKPRMKFYRLTANN